jgi:hypothetical protein
MAGVPTALQVHYASKLDVITSCGRVVSGVTVTGNRRLVTCPQCLNHG